MPVLTSEALTRQVARRVIRPKPGLQVFPPRHPAAGLRRLLSVSVTAPQSSGSVGTWAQGSTLLGGWGAGRKRSGSSPAGAPSPGLSGKVSNCEWSREVRPGPWAPAGDVP